MEGVAYINKCARRVKRARHLPPPLEVDAMQDRIRVGAIDTPHCLVSKQINSQLETLEATGVESSVIDVLDLESGLDKVSLGGLDILAVPAKLALQSTDSITKKGCQIVGARTPRRPSRILVSPNRLMYQPKSAIIVCEIEIVKRQLLRTRPDLVVIHPDSVEDSIDCENVPADAISRSNWLGNLLRDGKIDGFISSRKQYDDSGQSERRHTLLPFPQERGGPHFLPPAYSDLIAIVCRIGSAQELGNILTEPEGNTVLWVQSRVMGGLSDNTRNAIGIQVRHRQVGSLLRQAEEYRDIVLEQACHNPEGEIIEEEVRVEVRIETISSNGSRTIGLDRIVAKSEYQHATISLLRDWDALVYESSRKVPKDHHTDKEADAFLH